MFCLVTGNVDVVAGALAVVSDREDEGCHLGMVLPSLTQMALNHHSNL